MRLAIVFGLLLTGVLGGAQPGQAPPPAPVNRSVAAPASASLPARRFALLAERRYSMHAGIRPLYVFWIRRDNVGSARFCWRRGPDGSRGYEMTVGSDPTRAPRKVNKWGYFSEEATPAGIAMLGIMKTSNEETITEVEKTLATEGKGGAAFRYTAIRSEVRGDSGRTGTFRMRVERDLTYRDVDELLGMIPADIPADRTYRLPAGVRGGYLQTIADILHANVEWYLTKGASPRVEGQGFRYMYNGGPYEMVLRSSKFVRRAKFKNLTWTNLVEGHFRITNQTTGFKTDFRVDYGTEGELMEVPVHVVFQPRWWLEVELVLDEQGVY